MHTFERVVHWLHDTPQTLNGYAKTVCGCTVVAVALMMFALQLLALMGAQYEDLQAQPIFLRDVDLSRLDRETLQALAAICPEGKPIWSILEECLFRALLLTIVIAPLRKWRAGQSITTAMSLLAGIGAAILFGLAHGGWLHVSVQGMMGVSCAIAFLKCGGIKGEYFAGTMTASATHVLANELLVVIQYFWMIWAIR